MSASVEQMRTDISSVYPNGTWSSKVARMSDSQVIAIYLKFLSSGKFEEASRKKSEEPEYEQLRMDID